MQLGLPITALLTAGLEEAGGFGVASSTERVRKIRVGFVDVEETTTCYILCNYLLSLCRTYRRTAA
jgi:hypothetical protein